MPLTLGQKLKWMFVAGGVVRLNEAAVDLFNKGEKQEALKKLMIAYKRYPFHAPTNHNLGNVYGDMGLLDDAEKHFKKAIELKPDFVEAFNDFGTFLHKQNRVTEAISAFRKAIEARPDYPYSHVNLATVLMSRGSFLEAENELKAALDCKGLDEVTRKKIEDQLTI